MEGKCPACGAMLTNGECEYCGYKAQQINVSQQNSTNTQQTINIKVSTENYSNQNISDKSWLTTLLLAIFLGIVGGHKFYEGKIGMGILYIFTCGLFGIGVIIDIIKIITKTEQDKSGRLIIKS